MTTPDDATFRTLDDLASLLGLTRRGALSVLTVYATYVPIRSRQGIRRQLLIHPEELAQIQEQYEQARYLSLSLETWLRLQTEHGLRLPEDWKENPGRGGMLGEVQRLRTEMGHMTRLMDEVLRNQTHLLRVVSRGSEGSPVPIATPIPAPAPAPA